MPRNSHRKQRSDPRRRGWMRPARVVTVWAVVVTAAVIAVIAGFYVTSVGGRPDASAGPPSAAVHHRPGSYLGVYTAGVPQSYAGVRAFTATTGVRPRVVVYYSGWLEPFQVRFAAMAARHDAVPIVQIDPTDISLTAIASGRYDAYLHSYASAVKAFGHRVILSFGHEMNGHWYSWGHRHTSPAAFVAAWRHIVTVFRMVGARNVTWLWTVNVMHPSGGIPSPARWWPGGAYVNWVGIDGYYHKPSWKFAPLFGPTIKAVRALTLDPILISETAAPASGNQSAKVTDLFAGIRNYGLLGFVWFNSNKKRDWRLSPEAIASFRRGAEMLKRPAS
jgi:Glycosyl hydrolase family 26